MDLYLQWILCGSRANPVPKAKTARDSPAAAAPAAAAAGTAAAAQQLPSGCKMPKQPFSGAQKKKQMLAKRERQRKGVGEEGHKPSFKDSWDFGAQERATRDTGDGSYGGGTATAAAAAEKRDAQEIFHGGKPVVLGADGQAPAVLGADGRIDAMGNRGVKAPMFGGGESSLGMSNANGYRLRTVLTVDSKETIEARKKDAYRPLSYVHGAQRFVSPVSS